jgi:hypothetical protein
MIYSNPASWERVSNILWGFNEDNGILKNFNDLTTLISGLLNSTMTRMFLNFIKERKDLSPKDVFYHYDNIRKDIIKFTETSNNSKIGQLMESFVTFLLTTKPTYTKKELENISLFLTDIPSDISVLFLVKLRDIDRKSEEYKYFTDIHIKLIEGFPVYKTKFYESMVDMGKKVNGN